MLTQTPKVCFGTGEARTMDARLLSRADADRLTIDHIAHGVGLCELQRDPGDKHIAYSRFWKILTLRNNSCKIFSSHWAIVATLFHAHAEDLSCLGDRWLIGRINLKY